MAEYLDLMGWSEIKARLPGYAAPIVLSGTIEDHRPDLTARQPDSKRTPVIIETVPGEEIEGPDKAHRWTLLASASQLYGAELHFVVPRWTPFGPGDSRLRRRLVSLEISHRRIWSV